MLFRSEAAERGKEAIVDLLLANGAEIDAKDRWGKTPLFLALWAGQESAAQLLIAKGADVNSMDRDGYTPLLCAFRCTGGNAAELLVTKGAVVNVKSTPLPYVDGRMPAPFVIWNTPLHYAATFGYDNLARLLITKRS